MASDELGATNPALTARRLEDGRWALAWLEDATMAEISSALTGARLVLDELERTRYRHLDGFSRARQLAELADATNRLVDAVNDLMRYAGIPDKPEPPPAPAPSPVRTHAGDPFGGTADGPPPEPTTMQPPAPRPCTFPDCPAGSLECYQCNCVTPRPVRKPSSGGMYLN